MPNPYPTKSIPARQVIPGDVLADYDAVIRTHKRCDGSIFHRSHRSNLLRKDPDHYGPIFLPDEPSLRDDVPYVWPVPRPRRTPHMPDDTQAHALLRDLVQQVRYGTPDDINAALTAADEPPQPPLPEDPPVPDDAPGRV